MMSGGEIESIAVIGLGATIVGQVCTVGVVIWRSGRKDGEMVTEAKRITEELGRLTAVMERHAGEMETVRRDNAVQDQRLDEHGRRLDVHEKDIDQLWRRT